MRIAITPVLLFGIGVASACSTLPVKESPGKPEAPPTGDWEGPGAPQRPRNPTVKVPSKQWKNRDSGVSWQVGTLGRFRHLLGGEFHSERVIKLFSSVLESAVAVNLPAGRQKALSPYIPFRSFRVDIKNSEMIWIGGSVGAGLRYFPSFKNVEGAYLKIDASYQRWNGRNHDRLMQPGRDVTLFKRKGTNLFRPRDLDRYALGAGVGLQGFRKKSLGTGMELAYVYSNGTEGYEAHWIEYGISILVRF